MSLKSIDAGLLKKMFIGAAASLESQKEVINELNVFPVPDGDTGTNMTMTIMSAVTEVNNLENPTMEELAKAISGGSLRGARGNSGVILSQLLRGFTKVIKTVEVIDIETLANSFQKAVETAYKAVMKPKEGTILTVAKGGAEKAMELVGTTDDLTVFADKVIAYMAEVLDYTPELLPVLKEAGVVDSGGQGLLEVMKGAFAVMCGKKLEIKAPQPASPKTTETKVVNTENISTSDIKFGYCTEFIILLDNEFTELDETEFKAYLESIGDSIVCVADDEVVKVHVHTNDPGLAIQKALTFGQLTKLKIDNMREEHNEKLGIEAEKASAVKAQAVAKPKLPPKENGFISVSVGDGVNEIFKGLGVDYLIEGGQTMNPSTEDMLNAIEQVNAKNIFILPNNKNIILAADQAKAMTKDKNIVVIPSKTIPQGIAAVINFVSGKSIEENEASMKEAMDHVKTGSVTYAVRDTKIDGLEIKNGDFMGLDDHSIKSTGADIKQVTVDLIDTMVEDDSELISIYFGSDASEDEANEIADLLMEKYDFLDVEVHAGDQPVYYYIISVE
ncbi:MAG: DAK2 domain-containing protein [Lachnospiraceae bacterium]|nr:DAK2 domain-containing protein [Lachnospiraceae bacterium]MBR4816409.1 DAK2 domain-containing protein [Lachnospiraceae bacterium]